MALKFDLAREFARYEKHGIFRFSMLDHKKVPFQHLDFPKYLWDSKRAIGIVADDRVPESSLSSDYIVLEGRFEGLEELSRFTKDLFDEYVIQDGFSLYTLGKFFEPRYTDKP